MSKIIVVTGASGGIGAAILRKLAQEGHQVVGLARRAEMIEDIAKENPGWKVFALKVDVTQDKEVVKAFEWVKEKFGKIDVMINNAGISGPAMLADGEIDVWRKMYELNVFAVGSCNREALKIISDDGNIINVSSVLGQEICSFPGMAVYSSTKHALRVLTKGLRAELFEKRPGVKVTLLNPGLVDTPLAAGLRESGTLGDMSSISAEDVAHAASYILSTPKYVDLLNPGLVDTPMAAGLLEKVKSGFLKNMPYINAEDVAHAASYIVSTPKYVDVTELSVQHSGEYVR